MESDSPRGISTVEQIEETNMLCNAPWADQRIDSLSAQREGLARLRVVPGTWPNDGSTCAARSELYNAV